MKPAKRAGFRSILCPIDFSEPSQLALGYARHIARRSGAALHVLYVNDPFLVAAAAAALHDRDFAKRSLRELNAFVNGTLGVARRSRRTLSVSTGNASLEIAKVARARRVDLIAMGTHGLTGADRLLVGSTTLGVLRRTTVPVLAVPLRPSRKDIPASWPGPQIVAAVDMNGRPGDDVAAAVSVTRAFATSLRLVHVVTEIIAPVWLKPALSVLDRQQLTEARHHLASLAAAAAPRAEIDVAVAYGAIGEQVAAIADGTSAQLIVTTLRDQHCWSGPKRGSISYQVLSHANVPVLACPPRWRMR